MDTNRNSIVYSKTPEQKKRYALLRHLKLKSLRAIKELTKNENRVVRIAKQKASYAAKAREKRSTIKEKKRQETVHQTIHAYDSEILESSRQEQTFKLSPTRQETPQHDSEHMTITRGLSTGCWKINTEENVKDDKFFLADDPQKTDWLHSLIDS